MKNIEQLTHNQVVAGSSPAGRLSGVSKGTYDTNLPNNQWQTTEGTGGVVGSVLKQKVELKSKSIKL
jgi:hypothetical protein